MKVVVLHDLVSDSASEDLLDNLVQAEAVSAALGSLGHEVTALPMVEAISDTAAELLQIRPQAVFNLVESPWGTGRLAHWAPSLLESLGLRFTGADSHATLVTTNKLQAKRIMRENGLPTPTWLESEVDGPADAERYIIKSVWEHGSVGLDDSSVIEGGSVSRIAAAISRRNAGGNGPWFAEAFIDGREFNLSVLASPSGPDVLPPAEIVFKDFGKDQVKMVGYAAKWHSGAREYENTPRSFDFTGRDADLLDELKRLSLECWQAFGLRGYVRVDFRVDCFGNPWILEINTNPCLSPDAGFAAAAARGGLTYADMTARILAAAAKGRSGSSSVQTPPQSD